MTTHDDLIGRARRANAAMRSTREGVAGIIRAINREIERRTVGLAIDWATGEPTVIEAEPSAVILPFKRRGQP